MNTSRTRHGDLNRLTMHHDSVMDGGGAGGGGGGGDQVYDFRQHLPEDLRKDPVFDTFKPKTAEEFIGIIGKGYAHAQRSLGTARLEAPNDKWTSEQWGKFWNQLGRPEAPDKYEVPEFKFAEGLKLVPEKLQTYQKLFHDIGLTKTQAKKVMEHYFKDVNEGYTASQSEETTSRAKAEQQLKDTFKDKYDANMDIARSTLKKFGSESFVQFMNDSGLGNHPEFVQFMLKIGMNHMEDGAGGGGDLQLGARARAEMELKAFKENKEKMAALNDRGNSLHKSALAEWEALHKAAV